MEIKAKVRYSLMSSFVRIYSFFPAKYLIISKGILKPAAPAMIMAGISKMPWGASNSKTSYKLAPFSIAILMFPPSKKPLEIIFSSDVTPSVNAPESIIKITCTLFFRMSVKLRILKTPLVALHFNITQEIIVDAIYVSVDISVASSVVL